MVAKSDRGLVIDKSKESFKALEKRLKSEGYPQLIPAEFNKYPQNKKLEALRKYAGKVFDIGKRRIQCLSKDHEDRHPSMGFYRESGGFHCFSCCGSCDIFDIAGSAYSLPNFKQQYAKVVELFVGPGGDTVYRSDKGKSKSSKGNIKTESDKKWRPNPWYNKYYHSLDEISFREVEDVLEYIPTRFHKGNFNLEEPVSFIKRFPIKAWECNGPAYMVFFNDDRSVSCRLASRGYADVPWRNSKGNVGIFNAQDLEGGDIVFICESCFDALTVKWLTGYKAVSVNGLNNFSKISNRSDVKMVLLFDSDEAGRSHAQKYVDRFFVPDILLEGYNGDSVLSRFNNLPNYNGLIKDVNGLVNQRCLQEHKRVYIEESIDELHRLYREAEEFYNRRNLKK